VHRRLNDTDSNSESCDSVGEDEYGQREINRMLSPVFDESAGLMPVLVEDSDESISSPELSPTKPVMVLKRPHINKKLSF